MPFCPGCRNEYESRVARCPDCEVDLVAERPEDPREAAARSVAWLVEDEALGTSLARALRDQGVPCASDRTEDGRSVLVWPSPYEEYAIRFLRHVFPTLVFEPGEEFPRVRRHDPARDAEIVEHPVLQRSPKEIREGGEGGLGALEECALRGNAPVRDRALRLLARLGDEGLDRIAAVLERGFEGRSDVVCIEALGTLGRAAEGRKTPWSARVRSLGGWLDSDDRDRRLLGAKVAGRLRLREALDGLVRGLREGDPELALECDDALVEITGQDLGFDPEGGPGERERASTAREAWGRNHPA